MKNNKQNNWIKNKPIAHRGLHSNPKIPENSILSFELAIEKNLPIELDLQLTRDGRVVVFHDDDLTRVCQDSRNVVDVDLVDLEELKLFSTDQKIPSLKSVLELVEGRVPLLIEIKNRNYNGHLEDVIYDELKNYEGDYAIQSFNPFTVNHFKKKDPKIMRGLISGTGRDFELPLWKTFVLRNLLLFPLVKPHFINYEAEGLRLNTISFIRKFCNTTILGWTIDSREKLDKYKNLCHNIIFEKITLD